jgi:hypothetical protein
MKTMFVLIRATNGKFVANPGNERSYVTRLRDAWVFPTRDAAEEERCVETEYIAAISDVLLGLDRRPGDRLDELIQGNDD